MRALPPNFHSHEHGGIDAPPLMLMRPAYIIMPFIRAPVGFAHVRPLSVIFLAGWLVFGPPMFEFVYVGFTRAVLPGNLGHEYVIAFALAYAVAAFAVYARRLIGHHRSEDVHTAEAGYSWLVWLTPLPVWLCEIILVPAIVGGAGYAIRGTFSAELGWWLIITAGSLMLTATWESKRRWGQNRATVDDLIRAKTFEQRVASQERRGQGGARATDMPRPDIAELGNGERWEE